jgi:phosphoenolpyruvate synthase/pyruvate phosphate dikinase
VIKGAVAMQEPELTGEFSAVMEWADATRRMKVRTNAETPADAKPRANSALKASGFAAPSTCSLKATASYRCAR